MFSPELLLVGDRVVVIGREAGAARGRIAPGTTLQVVDIADPSSPTVVHEASYDSSLVTARQHGDVVRLVVSVGLPDLEFVEPGLFRRETTALERNQDVVRASSIDDWLPHVTTVGADGAVREQLVGCEDVAIPAVDAGLGTVVVAGFDVDDPASTRERPLSRRRARRSTCRPTTSTSPARPTGWAGRPAAGTSRRRASHAGVAGGLLRRGLHLPLRLRPRRHRDDVRRVGPGRGRDREPVVDGRARRRAAGGGRGRRRRPGTSTRS